MGVERWWSDAPHTIVNEVALTKKYIDYSIQQPNALGYKQQDYIIREINNMSRKVKEGRRQNEPVTTPQGRPEKSNPAGGTKTRWASADIRSAEHKQAIRELASNVQFILDTIVELVDDGYELHVKRTDAAATVRSMLFCKIGGHPNANGGLSAEAPDAWLSLTALVYKHSNILVGEWFDEAETSEESDLWK